MIVVGSSANRKPGVSKADQGDVYSIPALHLSRTFRFSLSYSILAMPPSRLLFDPDGFALTFRADAQRAPSP